LGSTQRWGQRGDEDDGEKSDAHHGLRSGDCPEGDESLSRAQ
jgi:hypothetical protein